MNQRLIRYADLVSSGPLHTGKFGSEPAHSEDFIIVAGVAAHPAAGHAHIAAPHEFDVHGLRRWPGGPIVPHYRDGAEVLVAHVGRWRLLLGPNGEEGSLEFSAGDVVSVPAGVYRRVEKLDGGDGFLFIVQASKDQQLPNWTPAVHASVPPQGFHVVTGGSWIDCSSGTPVLRQAESPKGANLAAEQSRTDDGGSGIDVSGIDVSRVDVSGVCAVGAAAIAPNPASPLAAEGVEEAGVVSTRASRDGFEPGPIKGWWQHGFALRRLTLQPGAFIPMHSRQESEVLILQEGTLAVLWAEGVIMMGAGDLLTVPVGLPRALRNTTSRCTQVFAVRGSEDPAMPIFDSPPPRA